MFGDYTIEYCKTIVGIENKWDEFSRDDVFLQSKYLRTLEAHAPQDMQFRYVCLMENTKAIGVLYFQIIKRSLSDSLQNSTLIKRSLASLFQTHIMISGNSLVTGDYGFHFLKTMDPAETFRIIDEVSDIVRKELKKEKIKVGAHLKKDFKISALPSSLENSHYTPFQVQPNMQMELRQEWKSFEDYLSGLKSKYRVRLKRARKKSMELLKRELHLEDLEKYNEEMYAQYMETVRGAGFNLFYLNKFYNIALKKGFGDDFKVFGYFKKLENGEEELIGYYTLFINGKELDAHFLGYKHAHNGQYQTYFNFLIDMIEFGIGRSYKAIHMSRTALEIKSSVGAEAEDLKVFLKYNNKMINRLLPRALDYFVPKQEWKPRSPYK